MHTIDIESTIRNLNVQVAIYNLDSIDTWLPVTMEYVRDYYGYYGQPTLSMAGLIIAKNGARYYGNSPDEIKSIGQKALEQVKLLLIDLERMRARRGGRNEPTEAFPAKNTDKSESGFRMSIKAELFWTIAAAAISGAFAIGLYFGNTKFDKEKIDYYNQMNKLSADTSMLLKSMQSLKEEINFYKLKVKADSLNNKQRRSNF